VEPAAAPPSEATAALKAEGVVGDGARPEAAPSQPGAAVAAAPAPSEDDGLAAAAAIGAGAALLAAAGGPLLAQTDGLAQAREGLAEAIRPVADSYPVPIVMGLPPTLLHWSHGGNTFAVLAVVGGFGVAEGLTARRLRRSGNAWRSELHSTSMLVVLACSALTVVGALASMRYDQQPIFESPHAWSALVAFILLLGNALLGSLFKGASGNAAGTRDLHAKVGAAWVAATAVNGLLGVLLGLSFSPAAPAVSEYSYMDNLGLEAYATPPDM